ncbi:hypothetical protein BH20ACT19_BH20ACT19_00980 [soil metagenome]
MCDEKAGHEIPATKGDPVRSGGTVVAFAGFLGSPSGLVWVDEASAAQPGRWIGTTHGSAERSSRWASDGSTQTGDFWFTVDRRGRVSGQAVVAYDPHFDAEGLNALLGYARGLTQAAVGTVPFVGAFGAAQLNAFIGVKIRHDEPLAIRRGQVTGTLDDSRLSLRWVGRPAGIRFRASITTLKGEKRLTGGSLAVDSPFGGTGEVVGGGHAVSTKRSKSMEKGVTEQTSSYWTAHRVGGR